MSLTLVELVPAMLTILFSETPAGVDVPKDAPLADATKGVYCFHLRHSIPSIKNKKERTKFYYSGYAIMVECSTNYYVDDDRVEHYQASIIGKDRDTIELQVPACSHVILHGNSEFQQAVVKGYLPDYVHQGVVDGRHDLVKESKESSGQSGSKWKHIQLKFQKGHCLSGMDVDGYAGYALEMPPRFFHAGTTSFIYWVVVRAEIDPIKVDEEGTSKGAALLKAMASRDENANTKRPYEKMIERAYDAIRDLADAVKNKKHKADKEDTGSFFNRNHY